MTTAGFRRAFPKLLGPLIIFAAAATGFAVAGRGAAYSAPGQLSAAFWPRMLLACLMVACVAKAWSLLTERSVTTLAGAVLAEFAEPPAEVDHRKLVAGIGLVAGLVIGSEVLGFPVAAVLFLGTFMWLGGWRRPVSLLVLSVTGTVVVLYIFVKVVYLPLPKGVGVFEGLTVNLYRLLGIF
jgi:putative tricarboxylic transport membrane protein